VNTVANLNKEKESIGISTLKSPTDAFSTLYKSPTSSYINNNFDRGKSKNICASVFVEFVADPINNDKLRNSKLDE
jgi:hypothetical protein